MRELGSGLGSLGCDEAKVLIEDALGSLTGVEVTVFETGGVPEPAVSARSPKAPGMTAGRAALLSLMKRYLAAMMDTSISLLEIQKLMYFLQIAGEPLRLRFTKALYGPYAENLRHALIAIEGHFVAGYSYSDGGEEPSKPLELLPGAVDAAEDFLQEHRSTREHLERVAGLVEGFESPFGLELLSTVHWVMTHDNVRQPDEVVSQTHTWSDCKRRFSRAQIELAADRLARDGWIPDLVGEPDPSVTGAKSSLRARPGGSRRTAVEEVTLLENAFPAAVAGSVDSSCVACRGSSAPGILLPVARTIWTRNLV